MNTLIRTSVVMVMVLSVGSAMPTAAQQRNPQAALKRSALAVLTLPATGTFALGGEFSGTISLNRFERRGNEIIAVGLVAGVLSRGSNALGTAVTGEVAWPVRVSSGGILLVGGSEPAAGTLTRVAWSPHREPTTTLRRVQTESCRVLNVVLGPTTVDLLGFQVALSGVTLDLVGVVGTPLGDLVCAASDLLGNVAAVVNLLNSLLGLVTGLLGGLIGGLGSGAIPLQ